MLSFFNNAAQLNIVPFRESVLTDISPEKARLIEAISQLDLTFLDEAEQLKMRQLSDRLACILVRDDSLNTLTRRIRTFKDRLERDLLCLKTVTTRGCLHFT